MCYQQRLGPAACAYAQSDQSLCLSLEYSMTAVTPWGFGDLWRRAFIFRKLRSTGNYILRSGEQAHSFGEFWESCKKVKKNKFKNLTLKEKPPFYLIVLNISLVSRGLSPLDPTLL